MSGRTDVAEHEGEGTGAVASGRPPGPRASRRRRRGGSRRAVVRTVALLLVLGAWLGVSGVGGPLVGRLSEVQENDNASFLPSSAESTELAKLSARFEDTSSLPFFVVVERASGVTPADRTAIQQYVASLPDLALQVDAATTDRAPRLSEYLVPGPTAAVSSQDGKALLVPVLVDSEEAGRSLPDGESVVLRVAEALRAQAAADLAPSGLRAYVTGPGGLTADLVTAFGGIDTKLLGVTLTAVFVILLLVYRSPILPFAALLTSVLGLSAAALAVFPLAKNGTIALNGQSQGILSILVIGAATDYSLLLVSRYREELHDHESKYVAMRRAWRGSVEPIAASAATVVLGLLCLLLSQLGSTRGLGPVGALGIAGALLAALTLLPVLLLWPVTILALVAAGVAFAVGALAVNAVVGLVLVALVLGALAWSAVQRRRVLVAGEAHEGPLPWYARATSGRWLFWPKVPHVDHRHATSDVEVPGVWGRISRLVGRRPRTVWALCLVALLAAAAFVPTFKADGISTTETFRDTVESVTGSEVLQRHFPGGSGSPATLVVPEADADRALEVVKGVEGISSATISSRPGASGRTGPRKVVDGQVQIEAVLGPAADSTAGERVVERLRVAVDEIGSDVLVGGPTAVQLDVRQASDRDLLVIIPAVLVVILLVLMLLLRSVVAPVLLILANVLSFGATLGISALVFNHVLGFSGGDPAIPLYAFVFLVALGIDYSIFLMTRVREETRARGARPGMLAGLAVTGGVITSAGVVLAATFGALGTVPLLFLQQIAFVVAFGVLLDTLVVRSLLVPALGYDLGRRTWWPSRLAHDDRAERGSDVAARSAVARPGV